MFPLIGVLLDPIDSNESNVNFHNSDLENHTSSTAIKDSVYITDEISNDGNSQTDSGEGLKSNFPEIHSDNKE